MFKLAALKINVIILSNFLCFNILHVILSTFFTIKIIIHKNHPIHQGIIMIVLLYFNSANLQLINSLFYLILAINT